ncbi:Crp/Fnr family transcriptional regulator [Fulvivirgaceae bacterium BMA10]|uniref:Crp/Fnr family transcriptional regulator n=1 Tax=Splendidivirga corallicola TaxID=3051826 RepID=A0ABT8KNY8_9BACT|nr:Crp/Fnr family transcriptional regulator [Fulvivirgaceae bacterium BMA10]
MNISPLLNDFSRQYWPLEEKAVGALKERVIGKRVKKREYILQKGVMCNHFTFVVEGCFKMYKIDDKGKEHNLQFAIENSWIVDYGSFYSEKPSQLFIEALEHSEILQIARNDLFYLYDHFSVFDRNLRIIIEDAFIEQQQRVLQNISSTAEERYLDFLKRYPDLFNRISNVQIASYLGVTPEFLSAIRKKIALK